MPGPSKRPLEQRRLAGRSPGRDSGGRKLPDAENVVALRGVDGGAPEHPASLTPGGIGAERWTRLWRETSWLSPDVDVDVITRLCEFEDMRAAMREALADEGFYVMGSMGQKRVNPMLSDIRATEDQILKLERECGLTPSARGSLGVAEVKAQGGDDPLTAILTQQAKRAEQRRGSA